MKHYGGVSPAWSLKYNDFQPYYLKAETLYSVHGERGANLTEPKEESPYPCPPLSHEPRIQEIFDQIKGSGHKPFPLPVAMKKPVREESVSDAIRVMDFPAWLTLKPMLIQPVSAKRSNMRMSPSKEM